MLYYAFVRRDADRSYRAAFVDFPEWRVVHREVSMLPRAAWEAAVAHREAGSGVLPEPTAFRHLPAVPDDHAGYWMAFDLRAAEHALGGTVPW